MKTVLLFAFASSAALAAAGTATFDDLTLAPNSKENGQNLGGSFTSGGLTFSNEYYASYDGWSGFAYSNVNDTSTAGYGNQYAAVTGTAKSGSNYGVSFDTASITLAANTSITGLFVTNTTYAALSMQNGDGFGKKFGGQTGNDADFFSIVATGYSGGNATGSAEFFLADYRFANNAQDYIVKDWTWFDLGGLGAATEVRFSYTSSDRTSYDGGQTYYINTPTYFALDDVQTQAVPEPATLAALGFGVVSILRRRKGGVR